ncbi:TonB-dependent receptor (plasmid) [Bradyrhizobium sp. ISRA443]|uniref:TonB-dependent receptor domain-containing protein n=1 Tax=unclassified Bradyrhizobium TaxID=2631580 RepID=UPI00247B2A34|nr:MULTISPECIES: TonB-dependent receptor [unclassified Bradyrhizobium]WGS03180.1 TonB-dependent receptor [Bradyrhizobium sp. ISRA436]WGS10026.1 TonB-dependent receptor [Bradyrhizobium sp. ISRA437]WGS16911.1 TonB-dependent receptor [Bradyrhizobium sp. ISRA443]
MTSDQFQSSPTQGFGNLFFTAPGATSAGISTQSSRPVLRGLSDAKVRIQENGVGAVDVSDIAQDHAVPIDPLALQRAQVFRGPAALRFGSQAVGGVVDVTNNRIPTAAPIGGLAAELRSAVTSVDSGWESGLLLDAGSGNAAVHADVYGRGAKDYRIPSYPYLVPPDPAPTFNGRQPNSAMESAGASIGGSYLFDGGYAGLSISRFTSDYHVPGIATSEAQQHNQLEQTKIASKGEYRPDAAAFAAVRYWLGYSDYRHDEVVNNSTVLGDFQTIGATFKNRQTEGKLEFETQPLATPFGALTSIVGAQGAYQRLDTVGQAILRPAQTATAAAYFFDELKLTDALRTQLAGRLEYVDVSGTSFEFPSSYLPPPNEPASAPSRSSFLPTSISFATIKDLPSYLQASLTLQRIQRAPRALELFASGPDDSEKTFKIGNPDLTLETANTVEVGLRRTRGDIRFDANLYYTRYSNFIYGRATGNFCDADFSTCAPASSGDYIQVAYSQDDAIFRGGELTWQWDVSPLAGGIFGVEGQFDVVQATFTDGTNVPRIPPMRAGGGIYWHNDNWSTRLHYLHAFRQNNFAEFDTPTDGYDLLKLQIEHRQRWRTSAWGPVEVATGLIGDNLLNANIRNSVQFHKDEILLPGRTFKLFLNVKYGANAPADAPIGAVRGQDAMAFFTKAAPAPAWSWGGFYGGGHVGYAWGTAKTHAGFIETATETPLFGNTSVASLDHAGIGIQAGYDWTAGRMVAGIEGNFTYGNQRGSSATTCPGAVCNPALAPLDAPMSADLSYRFDWLATVRGRIGVAVTPETLAYVSAGVPFGTVTASGSVSGTTAAGVGFTTPYSVDRFRFGWAVGAGIETRLTGNWTATIDYQHSDLGAFRATPTLPDSAVTLVDTDARVRTDAVRVGVNYRFGAGDRVFATN